MPALPPFLGLPKEHRDPDRARYVVLPAPYERTVSYGKGTRHGPRAILAASQQVEEYDEELGRRTCEAGIHTAPPVRFAGRDARGHMREIARRVRRHLERGQFVFTLGGEHTVTVGAVEAYLDRFPDLCLLQVDAHADLRDRYDGTPFSHACVMRRFVGRCPFVAVGIRSLSEEEAEVIRRERIPVWFARDLRKPGWQKRVAEGLGRHVYVTIDVDGLDPSVVPTTGTPEPGGIGWFELLELLRLVALRSRIVGADVTELAPRPGFHAPDYAVAKLVYRLIGYVEWARDKAS
ncbi:MAG: agmatinase [Candidatus Binatia bacterium]|nr:MAG: agmatinase [Candidatus Binatia bacterium]